jgi:hypothetical protein
MFNERLFRITTHARQPEGFKLSLNSIIFGDSSWVVTLAQEKGAGAAAATSGDTPKGEFTLNCGEALSLVCKMSRKPQEQEENAGTSKSPPVLLNADAAAATADGADLAYVVVSMFVSESFVSVHDKCDCMSVVLTAISLLTRRSLACRHHAISRRVETEFFDRVTRMETNADVKYLLRWDLLTADGKKHSTGQTAGVASAKFEVGCTRRFALCFGRPNRGFGGFRCEKAVSNCG